MFIDHFSTYRQWKPFRWGIVAGVLSFLALLAIVAIEQDKIPWGLFSWYTLFLLVVFVFFWILVLYVTTWFSNWLSPPYNKNNSWKKP